MGLAFSLPRVECDFLNAMSMTEMISAQGPLHRNSIIDFGHHKPTHQYAHNIEPKNVDVSQ
jgi:hypothetical protein